jgi:rSAM/selenodomain-associated transferase 1
MRALRLGQVKTRLSRYLDKDLVLDLYRMFVLDTLETIAPCQTDILIFVDLPAATANVADWLGGRFSYVGQEGEDLGERMANAFAYVFSGGYRNAILIGSDTPDLPRTIVEEALDKLRKKDAVIGPSPDGGYYLIGFSSNKMPAQVFTSTIWGTDRVLSDTVAVLSRSGCDFHVLPEWSDIDHLQDLTRFMKEETCPNPYGRRTRAWVSDHREVLEEALARADGQSGL